MVTAVCLIEPDLLFYNEHDPHEVIDCCHHALILHADMSLKYGCRIGISPEFLELMMQQFPWNSQRHRDIQSVLVGGIERLREWIIISDDFDDIEWVPACISCSNIDDDEIIWEWKRLLYSCSIAEDSEYQIATIKRDSLSPMPFDIRLSVRALGSNCELGEVGYMISLVYDEISWAKRIEDNPVDSFLLHPLDEIYQFMHIFFHYYRCDAD